METLGSIITDLERQTRFDIWMKSLVLGSKGLLICRELRAEDTDLGLRVENGFACAAGEGGDHLKAVKADEVGLLGVILHKAHSPTMLLGPALGSRGHRHVQLNNCSGQCLGGESGVQWSLGGGNQRVWEPDLVLHCPWLVWPRRKSHNQRESE